MAEKQRIGDYPATITPIGYVDVGEEIWNVPSLLGCGGNVIVNVETIIDYLEGEDSLTEGRGKVTGTLQICKRTGYRRSHFIS